MKLCGSWRPLGTTVRICLSPTAVWARSVK